MRGLAVWILVIGCAASRSGAQAGDPGVPREHPDDPPAARAAWRVSRPSVATSWPTDLVPAAQVNVNGQGLNILGDAANEPSLCVDPTAPNRVAIGWRQFDSISSNFRQAGYAWSNDGGRTWTNGGVLEAGVFRSDPVLRSDANGRFYYYSLTTPPGTYTCQVFVSTDGGRTYSGATEAYGGDKAWIAVDRTGGPGHGNLYAAWDTASAYNPNLFTRSVTGGASFMSPIQIPGVPEWGTCDVGPDGQFYVIGKRNTGGFTFARSSTPFAPSPSFNLSVQMSLGGNHQYLINPSPNPGGLLGMPWVVVDRSTGPRRGWVYALCSVKRTGMTDPLDVMFSRSTDGGTTWSTPVKVNDEPVGANAWQWFGTLAVSPSGRLDVVFNDTREDPSGNTSRLRYTSSSDGGATWAVSTPLTPPFNSLIGWPQQNKIGDYSDMESDDVGASVAFAATFNGEQDVYFLRINDWDCNRNGIPDQQDLASGLLHDCDGNGIPDECEIAAGAKQDANHNGIPDVCECYADCNGDGVLGLADFGCFQTKFALQDPYADCNGDGVLGLADFGCFQTKFALGCP